MPELANIDIVPDDRFIAEVRATVAARRRVRRTFMSSALALAIVAGAATWYVDHRLSAIQRVDIGRPTDAADPDPITTGAPFNLLVVGFDGCTTADDGGGDAPSCDRVRPEGQADAIVVVHIDPSTRSLDVLHLPRDLSVRNGKKLSNLDAAELIDELDAELGLRIDHYVGLGFDAVGSLGDTLGIRLDIGSSIRDRSTGLDLGAGCHTIGGDDLLALIRARHLEVQAADGSWTPDPTGDLGRVVRQQKVLVATITSLPQLGLGDVSRLDAIVTTLERSAAVDRSLGNQDLLDLGHLLTTLSLRATSALPTSPVELGDGSNALALADADVDAANTLLEPFGGAVSKRSTVAPSVTPPSADDVPVGAWSNLEAC